MKIINFFITLGFLVLLPTLLEAAKRSERDATGYIYRRTNTKKRKKDHRFISRKDLSYVFFTNQEKIFEILEEIEKEIDLKKIEELIALVQKTDPRGKYALLKKERMDLLVEKAMQGGNLHIALFLTANEYLQTFKLVSPNATVETFRGKI